MCAHVYVIYIYFFNGCQVVSLQHFCSMFQVLFFFSFNTFSNLIIHCTYQHVPYLFAVVDCSPVHHVPHYTYQHVPYLVAIVDCSPVHHVAHYTNISMCWLFPVHHVPHCTHINTYHILSLLLTVPLYTMFPTTHISTYHILLLLLTVPLYTMLPTTQISACVDCSRVHHVPHCTYQHVPYLVAIIDCSLYTMFPTAQISTRTLSCCYCWLFPCTPCFPLHKYQQVPYLVAIVDCSPVHHVSHYTNINTYHILLLLLTVPLYTMFPTTQISTRTISCCYCWLYPCGVTKIGGSGKNRRHIKALVWACLVFTVFHFLPVFFLFLLHWIERWRATK